jgi:hypothetical protein
MLKIKILFIALFVSACSWGQILTFDFVGLAGNEATAGSNFNNANLTSSTISRGAGLSASANADRFNAINWSTVSIANAVTNNQYMQFTITPSAGYDFTVSSVVIQLQRSGTGNTALALRNSLDGYTANLDTQYAVVDNTSTQTFTFTFAQTNSSSAVTYRLYSYAEAAAGSGGIGDGTGNDLVINGTVNSLTACTTPVTQASALSSSNATTTGVDFSWTAGSGASGTLVSLRQTSTGITAPTSGTNYTANVAWASAGQIDVNNRVVYKSNGTTVTGISGLTSGTQYTATPYAYNGSGTNVCFNNTNPESFDFYTLALEPTTPTGSFSSCSAVSTTSISLGFTAASTITNASGYILVYRQGAAPTGLPTDGTIYAAGATIGDATVFNYISAAATTATVTGLNGGSTYYFALIPYGVVAGPIAATVNYRTATTITTNCNTSPAAEINIKGVIGSNPSITDGDITPSSLDNTLYATLVVGSPQAKVFRIENTGNATLTVSSITMVGGNTGDFVVSGITLPTTIAALATLDFTVTFTPSAAGTRSTTLTIANSDANEASYDYLIQGTGSATPLVEINVKGNGQSIPDNSIYPSGTNHTAFPVTLQGNSNVRTFTIENLGTTALSITSIVVSGAHSSLFIVSNIGTTPIPGGSSITFDVTFSPLTGGSKNATITINNSDSDEGVYNFNISGTCQGSNNIYVSGNGYDVPKASVTTSTTNLTDFGLIAITTGVKQNTFVITNLSGSTRYLSTTPVLTGTDASMFTVVGLPTNGALSNSNTTSFTISFTPTSAGVKTATVTFNVYTDSGRTTADSIDGTFSFALSGEGIVYIPCSNNSVQTIVVQDFEAVPATPTWTYTAVHDGAVSSSNTYNNGSGSLNGFVGARAYQFTGIGTGTTRSAVLTMAAVDVSNYNNINFSMRVGAFRGSGTTQGVDVNELVQVETSIDGGVNWSVESVLRGYTNSRWSFATTGTFNAYYTGVNTGSTMDTRNGNAELTGASGISYYYVKNLPQSASLLIRITLNVDRSDEVWALDDIKIEGQTAQSSTWNGSAWIPSFPTSSTKAIFDTGTTYVTTAAANHGSVEACELQIKSGANVTVDSGYYMEIQSNITNVGTLNIADSGSLVQVNDTATNSGNVIYNRTATNVDGHDYVYWSSPVASQTVGTIYASPTPGFIYKWSPLATNINSPLSSGNWQTASGSMSIGEGYIVRGSSNYWLAPTSIAASFTGTVNNGVIPVTVSRGTNTIPSSTGPGNGITVTNYDDNWNLLGNPYPSSINAIDFLTANTAIEGYVYLWTHGSAPATIANPFYGSFLYNYANTDYITYNSVGGSTGPSVFNGYIGGGQGFFVMMDDGVTGTGTINFKNNLRSKGYSNSQFYRTSSNGEMEKHRIWLDIVDSNNESSRALIGYVPEATNGLDRLCDANKNTANSLNIYSVVEDKTLVIQGRTLPFNTNDVVPIGVRIMQDGAYKIAIAAVDGLFADTPQSIYLEDKQLGVIYDLRISPYSFNANAGIINDRFVLRYTASALGNPDFGTVNNVVLTSNHGLMSIKSSIESIQDVTVYDILGRELFAAKSIGNTDFTTAPIVRQQTLIVKIKLENGNVVTRKIIL